MPATNPVIDRLKATQKFEHGGNSYQVTRSTPFTICDKYYDVIVERKLKRILEIGTQYAQSTLFWQKLPRLSVDLLRQSTCALKK